MIHIYIKGVLSRALFIFAFLLLLIIPTNKIFAETIVGRIYLSADTTWTKADSPYVVSELGVNTGVTLTLEPGVVIKLGKVSQKDSISISGILNAQGTKDEPIYFTSYKDDTISGDTNGDGKKTSPVPGDWMGMIMHTDGVVNLDHTFFAYGGFEPPPVLVLNIFQRLFIKLALANTSEYYAWQANIYNNGGALNVQNSVISYSKTSGIHHSVGVTTISNSVIKDNNGYGIYNDSGIIIDAKNNYWGDARGPYDSDWDLDEDEWNGVSANVDFTPWLITDPALDIPLVQKNPVIIIPGILASYLNRNDDAKTEVWPNLAKAFKPGTDDYLDELALNQIGQPNMSFPVMLPTDIFRTLDVLNLKSTDFFGGLIQQLEDGGYVEGEDLFVFPYDWRLNIVSSVSNVYSPMLISLKDRIDEILLQTGADKVDIVAHSMGGLLSKYYIMNYGQDKVDKFIDIATPHLGAPSTLSTLMSGDNLGIKFGWLGLNPNKIQELAQNIPAIYQLLPSQAYFSTSLPDYSYYIYDINDYDNDNNAGRLSFGQSNAFLKNTGRNDLLLDTAPNIHNTLDNMDPADYGVKTYNIVGCGTPTMGKFFTFGKQDDQDPEFDIAYISGDGTVPMRSAEAIPASEQYYMVQAKHSQMPSASGVKELVASLLSEQESAFDFSAHSNMSASDADCQLPDGTFLSFHSPVAVNIYDQEGNHTGPDNNGDIEDNIPNVIYNIFENNKFVYLPAGGDYEIKLQATAVGSFSSHIKILQAGEIVSTSYFSDIPLASISTTAEVDISEEVPNIILSAMGDNTDTLIVEPTTITSGDILEDTIPPEFILSVDPEVFELVVAGQDNTPNLILTSTEITVKKEKANKKETKNNKGVITDYLIIDTAGNNSKMIIEVNRENDKKLNYDISFPEISGGKDARMTFERVLNKNGVLKTFTQSIKQGKDAIIYIYKVKKDKTVIRIKDNKEISKEVYPDQKLIQFVTNRGLIEINK